MSDKYLDHIREINKIKSSKCHICQKQSTGINAYGYTIKYVCDEHKIEDKTDFWATQISFE